MLTMLVNFVAIVAGIQFVVSIINPDRYRKVAKDAIKTGRFEKTGAQVDQAEFMKEFILLEKRIREILKEKDLYIPYGDTPRMIYSFRQMANALFRNELISKMLLDDLLKINKYRNLVFHGHINDVDKGMIEEVQRMKEAISNLSL